MKDRTLHEGKLQGQFVEKTRHIAHRFSGMLIGFLKKETEEVLRTNSIKAKIDKQPLSPKKIVLDKRRDCYTFSYYFCLPITQSIFIDDH